MTDSHQECIAEGVFDGVVEFGKHRINIQKYHHIKDTKCKENDIQYLRHCSADITYNTQIHVKDSCNCKHDKIDDSCLFEVLFKGFEEASDNIRFFVTCHFQCDIVECSQ